MSLKAQATRGAAWSGLQNAMTQGLTFLTFIVLARLLGKDDFGLLVGAMTAIVLLELVIQMGFHEAIVQRSKLELRFVHTAFWANLIGSGVICSLLLMLSDPLAALLVQSEGVGAERTALLADVLKLLCVRLVLAPFVGVPTALLQRDMDFRALAIRGVVAAAVGGVTGVTMAFAGLGVWSLVGLQIMTQATSVVVLWLSTDWRPAWVFSFADVRALLSFGLPVLSSRLCSFAAQRSSDFFILPVLGDAALGVFGFAQRAVSTLTTGILSSTVGAVGLSALSKLQDDRERFAQAFVSATALAVAIGLPAFVGLIAVAEPVVLMLGGEEFRDAVGIIVILAGTACCMCFTPLTYSVLIGAGRPRLNLMIDIVTASTTVLGFVLAVPHGIEAVALVHLYRSSVMGLVRLIVVRHILGFGVGVFLLAVLPPVVCAGVMFAAVSWAFALISGHVDSAFVQLALCVPLGVVTYILAVRLLFPSLWAQLSGMGRSVLGRKRGG